MDQHFPALLGFFGEHGMKVDVDVSHQWKPSLCHVYHKVGHDTQDYRIVKPRLSLDLEKAQTVCSTCEADPIREAC